MKNALIFSGALSKQFLYLSLQEVECSTFLFSISAQDDYQPIKISSIDIFAS